MISYVHINKPVRDGLILFLFNRTIVVGAITEPQVCTPSNTARYRFQFVEIP